MAKTYRLEEKVGIGTDHNITDKTGWTVHGSNLSYDQAVVKMKEADSKGGFQSDDEIGIVFKELQKIIIDLEKEIKCE